MNKPAPKEPSMDEILSSIRQIIADDDAAVAPRRPAIAPAANAQPAPAPAPRPVPTFTPPPAPSEPEPLALTAAQIVADEDAADAALSFNDILGGADADLPDTQPDDGPQLVDPEDIEFAGADDGEMHGFDVPVEAEPEPEPEPVPLVARTPVPVPRAAAAMPPPSRPAPSVARAAPMPDPTLSSDLAEQLLAPTTDAAVKHAFTRLNGVSMAGAGVTIDALMREMLRPMLKEWLDENLPSMVERMVEKEIARISRGGE